MKHLLTLTAMFMVCTGASAQGVAHVVLQEGDYNRYIPAEFTLDKKVKLLIRSDDDSRDIEDGIIDVYDDFVKVKTIALPSRQTNGYTLTRSREGVVAKDGGYRNQESKFGSLDEAVSYIADRDDIKYQYKDNDGNTIFVRSEMEFFNFEEFGTKYPEDYFMYEANTGKLYRCADRYHVAYTGSWIETKKENEYGSGSSDANTILFYDYDSANMCYDNKVVLTQTLFNSDSKYEYIRYKWGVKAGYTDTQDRDDDGEVDYEYTQYEAVGTGFEIVSEDGTVLQSVDFPVGKIAGQGYEQLLKLNGKYYLLFKTNEWNSEYGDSYSLVYSIGDGSTAVQQVGALRRTSARPSLADRNASITVETPAAVRDRRLTVTNAAGQTVWQQTIPAGQGSVQIDGRRLSRGLNIVNVEGDSKQDNSCKVIVK